MEPPFLQQDLSDNQHHTRKRRRDVLSNDGASSHKVVAVSRSMVLVPGASGDTPGSGQVRDAQ